MAGEEDEQAIPLISDTQPSSSSSALQSCGQVKRTEQFRNQTVITRKGTMLHVNMETVYTYCYLEQFRLCSLRYLAWLSIVAAVMSFSYSSIGLGLGLAKTIEDGNIKGDIQGVSRTTIIEKVWVVSQAIGDFAFAFTYNVILLEIELQTLRIKDTLKSPPPESWTMKKASTAAVFITTTLYLCCGCFGYAAFGKTPGNLLTGFGFYEPYWLIDFANVCIVIHLVGGYQIFSQPVFAAAERLIAKKLPNNGFVNNTFSIKLPMLPVLELNLLRLCFRTAYVASTTGIALLFPYFNQVLGALNFWPLAIYFPVELYIVQREIRAWSRMWVVLQSFKAVCLLVTIMAFVASVEGLVSSKLS